MEVNIKIEESGYIVQQTNSRENCGLHLQDMHLPNYQVVQQIITHKSKVLYSVGCKQLQTFTMFMSAETLHEKQFHNP
jgi:hypothetical protein